MTMITGRLAFLLICLAPIAADGEAPDAHGLVGLRLLPHDAEQAAQKGRGGETWLAGIGNYADLEGQYPFVAENLDVIWGPRGGFKTGKSFLEWYVEFDGDWHLGGGDEVNPDPHTSKLVQKIRRAEQSGFTHALHSAGPTNAVKTSPQSVDYILICRETRLTRRGKPGPFKEDYRILYPEDVTALRKLFREAHAAGLLKHDNYKMIQMVEHPSFFAENPEAQKIIRSMDGVTYEAHQFNRHWPLETGWSRPGPVVRGARWTLDQGLDYIFYYGPFRFRENEGYREFVEREWLHEFWQAGLPKRHPRMHHFLNAFPHEGSKRPVGPESDPHSNLGLTKWLIEEVRGKKLEGDATSTDSPRPVKPERSSS
jgi:hypothetical protein